MATALQYCTTGDIGQYIPQYGSDVNASTTLIDTLITRMSRNIDKITRRHFYTSTGNETITLNGTGRYRLVFPFDIVSITTLQLATDTVKATSGTYTTISTGDYYLMPRQLTDSGWPYQWLELSNAPSGDYSTSNSFTVFPEGYDTVQVVGKFGWGATGTTGVPDDIRHACTEMVVRAWRGRDMSFSDVVGVEGLNTATFSRRLPSDVQDILDHYTRQVVR